MSARHKLAVVFSLHFLLHVYMGVRLMPDIGTGRPGLLALTAVLLVSTLLLAPVGLLSSSLRRSRWSEQLSWAGLLAMGLFSSFFVLTLLRDVVLMSVLMSAWLGAWLTGSGNANLTPWSAVAVPLLALAVTLIGFVNARRVARVVKVDVPVAGLPAALHGYSIAQISDIHVGPTIRRAYLDAIVERVNALGADAIAVTGDLVDGSVQRLAPHTAPLGRLKARDGAFFVTGNHEYYSGAREWIAEVRRLGLTVLLNGHVLRRRGGASLVIAGVTDYSAHHFDPAHRSDPLAAIAGAPQDVAVKILLAHQPRSAPAAAEAGFDLQLSGHTHGGQFFPWNLFVPLQQPFVAGLHRVGRLQVYTSRGTGYWGPPKRFGAPSEITLVRLVPE